MVEAEGLSKQPQESDARPSRGREFRTESSSQAPASAGVDRGRSRIRRTDSDSLSEDDLDKKGYHALKSSFGKAFYVKKRWKLIREMGSGAYGHVISAGDEITKETVAIKLVSRVFDKVQLAKRALREITLLRHFTGHANITGLIDAKMISPDANEIYIFMEPMEGVLLVFVSEHLDSCFLSGLTPDHQIWSKSDQRTRSIFSIPNLAWTEIYSFKRGHPPGSQTWKLARPPSTVNSNCELKLCDFGLSRGFENASHLTEYVATRWYRAPEVMLGFRGYGSAIDVWSIGCILAELLSSQPLFKGKECVMCRASYLKFISFQLWYGPLDRGKIKAQRKRTVDQLRKILDVLGSPEENILQKIASEKARAYVRSLPISKKKPFAKILPTADLQAIDLLSNCLTFDPDARFTVAEALEHPWLSGYHEPEEEPDCDLPYDKWKDIEELTTIEQFRKALWDEIQDYRREIRGGVDDEDEFEAVVAAASADGQDLPNVVQAEVVPTVVGVIAEEPVAEEAAALEGSEEVKTEPVEPTAESQGPPRPVSPEKTIPTFPTDPVVTYARRSSIMQPSRQGSLYGSPRPTSQHLGSYFSESPRPAEPVLGPGTIAFPSSQNYVFPHTRSRTGSTVGRGEGQRRLLRTLSTVSIHESGEGRPGGLADIAPIGRFIVESQPSEADAPASEMPRILEDELGKKDDEERKSVKKESGFFI
ncbi:MAP kinase [Mycena indigotica]|uniref:MAP kinase n=1 Tax=Mycena indigotica TaxID=2126181 RepID=A0A8H6T0I1_9AGAR|nr:MAP kinase [Mycena indigotica]KAF7309710.1 MAP kinase [Mycena indigotica]